MPHDTMSKTERLGCLYLTFLNHPSGISFRKIKELLPSAYQGEEQSARRKFERDKDELKELGMELKCLQPGDTRENGARVQDYIYIPAEEVRRMEDASLTEKEAAELSRIIFRGIRREEKAGKDPSVLKKAAEKILYKFPELFFQPDSGNMILSGLSDFGGDSSVPGDIHSALSRRKKIAFEYHGKQRTADACGLISHRGRWCLVASVDDGGIRHFYTDEIRDLKTLPDPSTVPANFNIREYFIHPLTINMHDPVHVQIMVDDDRQDTAVDYFSGMPDRAKLESRHSVLQFFTTNLDALFSWMLRNPGTVVSIGPEEVHKKYIEFADAIMDYYR